MFYKDLKQSPEIAETQRIAEKNGCFIRCFTIAKKWPETKSGSTILQVYIRTDFETKNDV